MTEEEIKLKIEEEEKKEKKKKTIRRILIGVGSVLLIVALIVIGNVDFFVQLSERNRYSKENNYYLRNIRQDTYLEGSLKYEKDFVIKFFMYSFNLNGGGRDYLVVFWNMTDVPYQIKYKNQTTIIGPDGTSALVISKAYSENKGAYLNFKDFDVFKYEKEVEELNNESSYNEEKTCVTNLPINNVLVVLDDKFYVKLAKEIDSTEYCQDTSIGSYIVMKK